MKILFPVAAVLFVIVQSGCNGNSNSSPNPGTGGTATPAATPGPNSVWSQISERTSCESSVDAADCVGAYGFTVFSNGSYQVGPAQTGLYLKGLLAPGEVDVINQDAVAVAGGNLTSGYICAGNSSSSGNRDDVSVLLSGQNSGDVIYREYLIGEGSDCYIGDMNSAFQLHLDINNLMTEYYPVPFPSPTGTPSPTPSTSPSGTPVQYGNWGGTGIGADVESSNTNFDFNCAQGQTNGPLLIGSDGSFSAAGTYSYEAGPIVVNDPRMYAATYSGTVSGNQMNLTVQYTGFTTGAQTLHFTLTYNQSGNFDPICPLD